MKNTTFHLVRTLTSAATCLVLAGVLCVAPNAVAAAKAPSKAKKEQPAPPAPPPAPALLTVARGSVKEKTQLDAIFESIEMEAIKLAPKAWMDLTVVEAVAHGTKVTKGTPLVKLDTSRLEEQIEDLEREQPAAAIALETALVELENLEKTTPTRLEAARRSKRQIDEDAGYWDETGKAQREKNSRFSVKYAEQRLLNALEELTQLEKMYKADDLTEETEEIVLKRQKFTVEAAQLDLESTKLRVERDLKVLIPREDDTMRNQKRDQEVALAFNEQTLPKALKRKRMEVEKMKRDQKKAERRLADLRADLKSMKLGAPMDGVVYYGACEVGRWTTGAMIAKKLVPGGKLMPNEIFITIINPAKLRLKAVVPEADLHKVKVGMEGLATPTSASTTKLPVKLEELGSIPLPTSGFEAVLSAQLDSSSKFVAGMGCKLSMGDARKVDPLVIPKDCVFSEGDAKHVYLQGKDPKPEKRVVKTGEANDKAIEILEGLAEGDKVHLKKP